MNHLSIDLETLNTTPDAAIISIGACFFDPIKGEIGAKFYQAIDINNAIENGTVSGSTLTWWVQQKENAKEVFSDPDALPIMNALGFFRQWVTLNRIDADVQVWGNGATFDNVILEYAFNKEKILCPWKFNKNRDLRTIKELAKQLNDGNTVKIDRTGGTEHNALDDAINQANACIEYYRVIGIGDL